MGSIDNNNSWLRYVVLKDFTLDTFIWKNFLLNHIFQKLPFLLVKFVGTVTPMSGIGKLIGGICALMGVFTITLPVPIMVNNFHQFYKNKLWRGEVALQRRERQRLGVPDANPKKYSCVLATTAEKGTTKERQLLNQVELNGVQS